MFYTYILLLNNESYYVGHTSNLKQRLSDHVRGKVNTTSKAKNVKLVYYCAFMKKPLAVKFEKYLKSSSGFAFRNKRLI